MAEHIFTFRRTSDKENGKHHLSLGREFGGAVGAT